MTFDIASSAPGLQERRWRRVKELSVPECPPIPLLDSHCPPAWDPPVAQLKPHRSENRSVEKNHKIR
jgi:hypothetical protein